MTWAIHWRQVDIKIVGDISVVNFQGLLSGTAWTRWQAELSSVCEEWSKDYRYFDKIDHSLAAACCVNLATKRSVVQLHKAYCTQCVLSARECSPLALCCLALAACPWRLATCQLACCRLQLCRLQLDSLPLAACRFPHCRVLVYSLHAACCFALCWLELVILQPCRMQLCCLSPQTRCSLPRAARRLAPKRQRGKTGNKLQAVYLNRQDGKQ